MEIQSPIAFTPRTPSPFQPNIAPVFIGAHRTIGLWVGTTIVDWRISLVMDTRDGNGFRDVVSLIYQNVNGVYADMQSVGGAQEFLRYIVGRINEAGRLLPQPTGDCRKVTCCGLELLPWPVARPITPYPSNEYTAQEWLPSVLSNMRWTLVNGYLELVA